MGRAAQLGERSEPSEQGGVSPQPKRPLSADPPPPAGEGDRQSRWRGRPQARSNRLFGLLPSVGEGARRAVEGAPQSVPKPLTHQLSSLRKQGSCSRPSRKPRPRFLLSQE